MIIKTYEKRYNLIENLKDEIERNGFRKRIL